MFLVRGERLRYC